MKSVFAIIVFAAACGGGKGKTGVGNTGGTTTTPAASDPWSKFTQGATFDVMNDDAYTITATVTKVSPTADGRTIEIAWSAEGKPLESSLPTTFAIHADRVTIADLDFALAKADRQPDGREVTVGDDGTVCYVDGPGDNAGECPDVCEAMLCVNQTDGLYGGSGTWWPNYVDFHTKGYHQDYAK